jgi:uncharacterized protein (DUF433 family)
MRYMRQPLSLRLPEPTLQRLGARARRRRIAPRTLAQRYVEEGLRMDEHPLVRFADGPGGRDASLIGTRLRAWQVIDVVRENGGDVAAAADYLELPLGLVQAAVSYYGAYREEIDDAIEDNRREREDARAAWLAGQAALKR